MAAFTDQIAVVTGASSGIGKAIALSLAAQGATLCLIGRNQDRLEAVAATARVAAPRTLVSQIDLTRDAEIEQLAMDLQRKFGRVDVLVHSAGVIYLGKLREATIAELDAQYQANVRAVYLLTQADAAPVEGPARSDSIYQLKRRFDQRSRGGTVFSHPARAQGDRR